MDSKQLEKKWTRLMVTFIVVVGVLLSVESALGGRWLAAVSFLGMTAVLAIMASTIRQEKLL